VDDDYLNEAKNAYVNGDVTLPEFEDAVSEILTDNPPTWVRDRHIETMTFEGAKIYV